MQVEIYDERELDPETLKQEPDHEALELIEELGLTRQVNTSGSRLAYPIPSADQGFVMSALFPTATLLDVYDAGAIPLRVLKEIRSYRAENPDHLLVVRHSPPAEVKDPVLLAYTKRHDSNREYYARSEGWPDFRMVARWGDALESWNKLLIKAKEIATENFRQAVINMQAECDTALAKIKRGALVRRPVIPQTLQLDELR